MLQSSRLVVLVLVLKLYLSTDFMYLLVLATEVLVSVLAPRVLTCSCDHVRVA